MTGLKYGLTLERSRMRGVRSKLRHLLTCEILDPYMSFYSSGYGFRN